MRNAELAQRREAAVARGVASATSIYAARASNSEIWDVEGRRYIDFAGGIAVVNCGHRHPRIVAAVEEQLAAFTHTAFQVAPYANYITLAERLNSLAPVRGTAKSIFFTTGAEATENAVKISRAATGRPGIIAFAGGFHGRTLLGSAMTGKVLPYKKGFGPFPSQIYRIPFPSASTGVSLDECLRALDRLFQADTEPENIAAIIVEPVQGEGGFHLPDPHLFDVLNDMRERYGILLIADEVQTGFARTGKLFAMEHSAVRPDLITVAKALGGGFPLSGVIGTDVLMDAVSPGGLGGTYGGSPIAIAAAHAVLDVIEDERLTARAIQIGRQVRARITALTGMPGVRRLSGLRGLGAMLAFDVVDSVGRPDGAAARQICVDALDAGLILLTCGQFGHSIRLLPPLTIGDDVLSEGLDLLSHALSRSAVPA